MPIPKLSILDKFSFKKENTFWSELIGNPTLFSLESRIFHGISVGLIILISIYIPYNLYAGLYMASLSALLVCLFISHQYYYSRYHDKAHNNTIFGLIGMLIFGINYFYNSGINGSTDLIWPAYLLLIFAISPYRQHIIWLIVYLLGFLIIHVIEYRYPNLVKHPFIAGEGQFIDRISVFPIPVMGIYIIVNYFRRSYDRERKATEEKTLAVELSKAQIVLQKDQLEKSNSEKNKLMSIISHDLRTPLLNVQNYLALLNQYEIENSERKEIEKSLLHATNNTVEMLSNLLHWSKSQMQGPAVNLIKVNLLQTLAATLQIELASALKKEIALTYHIPSDLTVIADVDMLQLVVRNLISNAIKFTPQGGSITVVAQIVADNCKITITDTGTGIPLAQQQNIFTIKSEPSIGTDNEKGVGLGLVLCKEYIELQGGSIGFESNEETGSSFFIFIPNAIS